MPEPGEDAPEPGEDDEDAGDPADEDAALLTAEPSGEDDEDDAAFEREFGDDTGGGDATCDTAALKVGAVVHKAKVTRDGAGKLLVLIQLIRTGK